jgi:hypothetical protein
MQARKDVARSRIYHDGLAKCKSLVSMLADHGSEYDTREALEMFESFVKMRITREPGTAQIGNMVPNVKVKGKALGQRAQSSTEHKGARQPKKRKTAAPDNAAAAHL